MGKEKFAQKKKETKMETQRHTQTDIERGKHKITQMLRKTGKDKQGD